MYNCTVNELWNDEFDALTFWRSEKFPNFEIFSGEKKYDKDRNDHVPKHTPEVLRNIHTKIKLLFPSSLLDRFRVRNYKKIYVFCTVFTRYDVMMTILNFQHATSIKDFQIHSLFRSAWEGCSFAIRSRRCHVVFYDHPGKRLENSKNVQFKQSCCGRF